MGPDSPPTLYEVIDSLSQSPANMSAIQQQSWNAVRHRMSHALLASNEQTLAWLFLCGRCMLHKLHNGCEHHVLRKAKPSCVLSLCMMQDRPWEYNCVLQKCDAVTRYNSRGLRLRDPKVLQPLLPAAT